MSVSREFVCLLVWKIHFLVDWRLLVEECIANIGMPTHNINIYLYNYNNIIIFEKFYNCFYDFLCQKKIGLSNYFSGKPW